MVRQLGFGSAPSRDCDLSLYRWGQFRCAGEVRDHPPGKPAAALATHARLTFLRDRPPFRPNGTRRTSTISSLRVIVCRGARLRPVLSVLSAPTMINSRPRAPPRRTIRPVVQDIISNVTAEHRLLCNSRSDQLSSLAGGQIQEKPRNAIPIYSTIGVLTKAAATKPSRQIGRSARGDKINLARRA